MYYDKSSLLVKWALRDYGSSVETIWDSDGNCEHNFEIKERQLHSGTIDLNKTVHSALIKGGLLTDWKTKDGFCSKCGAWKGQLGLEPTFDLYIKHLCDIFSEVKRVLKKLGTCWINLGDTYNSGGNYRVDNLEKDEQNNFINKQKTHPIEAGRVKVDSKIQGLESKSLCLIPFRFAIEMQNRGWILRNVIIWHKPNVMPSSVKDRFTVDFEYLFFFVKNKKYFFETQYEPLSEITINDIKKRRNMACITGKNNSKEFNSDKKIYSTPKKGRLRTDFLNLGHGRNKRAVWRITTKPFKESHFAVYPEELCYTPIKAGCPEFVCNKCGKPREKIEEREGLSSADYMKGENKSDWMSEQGQKQNMRAPREAFERKIISKGYTSCSCNAEFSGGIVLDPFFGSGTTGLVALKQNKNFIGIELNPEYIKIAEKRLKPYLEQTKL